VNVAEVTFIKNNKENIQRYKKNIAEVSGDGSEVTYILKYIINSCVLLCIVFYIMLKPVFKLKNVSTSKLVKSARKLLN